MELHEKTYNALELGKVLSRVKEFALSGRAAEEILSLKSESSVGVARELLALTGEAYYIYAGLGLSPLSGYGDVTAVLQKAEKYSVLTPGELLRVAGFLRAARATKESFAKIEGGGAERLKGAAAQITVLKDLENDIYSAVLNETELSDDASPALRNIRRKIREAKERIKDKLNEILRKEAKLLQDGIITVRSGRFVVPVKTEYRSTFAGLLHDQSASGATAYIEPIAVVELNNELRLLEINAEHETERILSEFTLRVSGAAAGIDAAQSIMLHLDVQFARAKYAADINAAPPEINDKKILKIVKGRHPLLAREKVVPVDISVSGGANILLISGPNTGGKTVSLKTAGLFSLMAGAGLFIPAEAGTNIPLFNRIFCDIGDEQSIEQSLSTFSSHLKNISAILNSGLKNDLVLLDELGAGTDPGEGAALAVGITEYLRAADCLAVITTHYTLLKEYAMACGDIDNASMQFSEKTLLPTYKVIMGLPGASRAIQIAENLGLPESVIASARSRVDRDAAEFEEILKTAHATLSEAEKARDEYTALSRNIQSEINAARSEREAYLREREKLQTNARLELKRLIQNQLDEAAGILDEMREIGAEVQGAAMLEAKRKRKELENLLYLNDETPEVVAPGLKEAVFGELNPGDTVYIKAFGTEGSVLKTPPNASAKYEISCGGKTLYLLIGDLLIKPEKPAAAARHDKKTEKKPEKQPGISVSRFGSGAPPSKEAVKGEINVIGQTVQEAWANVSAYLDSAAVFGYSEVKIIHGKGTGALMKGLWEHLRRHSGVESLRHGIYGEGERGVTVVTLKVK